MSAAEVYKFLQGIDLIDAHHHFWELSRFPYKWLSSPGPARFGDKSEIAKDYLPQHYLRECALLPLKASVHVQANCGAADPVEETVWLQRLRTQTGWPSAIIGEADISTPAGRRLVERHARHSAVRGIRTPAAWDKAGRWRVASRAGVLSQPELRSSLDDLEREGLCLELVVVPEQLREVHELASAHPALKIVLNHFAHLEPHQPGNAEDWSKGICLLSGNRNVFLKMSGLWTVDRQWDSKVLSPFVAQALESFGSGRIMYGSNLPVERVNCPIDGQFRSLSALLSDLPLEQRKDIFSRTATSAYRLTLPSLAKISEIPPSIEQAAC